MTAAPAAQAPRPALVPPPDYTLRATLRLAWLHAVSRRLPLAVGLLAACAAGLRGALYGHWDAYGALQLPLVFESGCAVIIAATAAGPFGEPERATGRPLPLLRLGAAVALAALAAGLLTAAGTGMPLAGGFPDVLRNVAGLTGLGLLCAVLLGGTLAWTGPLVYLVVGAYALYTQWHPPALTTPWLWAARPPHDVGGTLCAAAVFAAGVIAFTIRGARESAGD